MHVIVPSPTNCISIPPPFPLEQGHRQFQAFRELLDPARARRTTKNSATCESTFCKSSLCHVMSYMHVGVYNHVCVCTYVRTYVRMYVCMYVYIYTYTYTYVYTHIPPLPSPGLPVVELHRALGHARHALCRCAAENGWFLTGEIWGRMMGNIWKCMEYLEYTVYNRILWNMMEYEGMLWKYMNLQQD